MLERYRDGEEIPELRAVVEAHLKACGWCRNQYLALQYRPASQPSSTEPAPAPATRAPEGLPDLLAHLRNWDSSRAKPEVRGPEIRRRVAHEIGRFLGGKAAQQILQPVTDDAGNLLPAIQPFLGRFLGRKAASHLSTRIIEVAVVRP